jgi:riboflavin kinase/FMN adenylyltransferase
MRKAALTLGTFDGIHRGHRALIAKVVQRARAIGGKSVVLAFDMPPRHAGEAPLQPVLLTTLSEKIQILKRLGVDQVHVLIFDHKTASTSPEDFFRQSILGRHHAQEMVVGPRVAFGKNRAGRLSLLKKLGREHSVRIHVVSNIGAGKGSVSSRRIRALLESGRIENVNRLLGYCYSVAGKVIHGQHRGRRLGFPTANIQIDAAKMLPRGVFWVNVHPAERLPLTVREALRGVDGICNVGVRPTFSPQSHEIHCEVFMFGQNQPGTRLRGNLYGKKIRVVFLRRIRGEKRFASADALKQQIAKDLATARLYKKAHFSI